MLELQTSEGLVRAALQIEDYARGHEARKSFENIWHKTSGHVAEGRIREWLPHVRGIPEWERDTTGVCNDYEKNVSLWPPRKHVALEDQIAIRPLD